MRKFGRSFLYAFKGLGAAIKQERNMRFHLGAAFYVLLFSFFYGFTAGQYCLLFLTIFGVFSAELFNSAIERVVDKLVHTQDKNAGAAKDMAAGAVLCFCVGAALCGIVLLWDIEVFKSIFAFFLGQPLWLVALVLSLGFWGWFIFGYGRKRKGKT